MNTPKITKHADGTVSIRMNRGDLTDVLNAYRNHLQAWPAHKWPGWTDQDEEIMARLEREGVAWTDKVRAEIRWPDEVKAS